MSFNFGGGFSSGSGSSFWSSLSDYASIRSGSYKKLMKSYYGTGSNSSSVSSTGKNKSSNNILDKIQEEKRNPKASKSVQAANSNLTAALPNLQNSIFTLQNKKTYTDTDNGQKAADKVSSAVKSFVKDYNSVVTAAKGSTLTNKTSYVSNMMSKTAANADKLAEIGIKVNAKGTLDIDEDKLKNADISKVQEMFSSDDLMSYGSSLSSRVGFASAADKADKTTSKEDKKETDNKTESYAASLTADGNALASKELYNKIKGEDGKDQFDIEKILSTAKSFTNNYNKMFEVAESSSNSGVVSNLSYIKDRTFSSANDLKQFGISVDMNGRLSLDENKFKKADMSEVKDFFKNYGSYIASAASRVDYYMTTQAGASNNYTSSGLYNVPTNQQYTGIV